MQEESGLDTDGRTRSTISSTSMRSKLMSVIRVGLEETQLASLSISGTHCAVLATYPFSCSYTYLPGIPSLNQTLVAGATVTRLFLKVNNFNLTTIYSCFILK